MEFPKDFVTQMKELFPHEKRVLNDLDECNVFQVGAFLEREDCVLLTPEFLLGMLDAERYSMLRVQMIRMARQRRLYNAWCEFVAENFSEPVGG